MALDCCGIPLFCRKISLWLEADTFTSHKAPHMAASAKWRIFCVFGGYFMKMEFCLVGIKSDHILPCCPTLDSVTLI